MSETQHAEPPRKDTAHRTWTDNESDVTITHGDAATLYDTWTAPTVIISDGAYGTNGFRTDPASPDELRDWYEPHVKAWSTHATPETTLWFWNTEHGWAEVHGLLKEHGWEYRGANTWDKGLAHIAGNSNTQTLRQFPQVTEICVQYVRSPAETLQLQDDHRTVQQWLRDEWKRTGLTFDEANTACGVADAATRKYFTTGDDWYFPPTDRFAQLREYANTHGDPDGRPYLTPDNLPFDLTELEQSDSSIIHQAKFDCPAGVTNVWDHPHVTGDERVTSDTGTAVHPNQKPLALTRRLIETTSHRRDTVWEPFGGLCTAMVAAKQLDRTGCASEIDSEYVTSAITRLENTSHAIHAGENHQSALDAFSHE